MEQRLHLSLDLADLSLDLSIFRLELRFDLQILLSESVLLLEIGAVVDLLLQLFELLLTVDLRFFSLTLLIPVPQFTDYSSLSTLLILPRSPSFTLSSQHNFLHATLNVLLQAKFEFFEKERAEAEINLKEMMSTLQAQMAAAGAQ